MIKKSFLYSLAAILFLGGMISVDAKTYTSYKVGDKIEVNVNDSKKEIFYIVKDNGDKVDAIYGGTLGENLNWIWNDGDDCSFVNSNIDKAVKERTSTWTNINNIKLPSADDIIKGFDYSSFDELDRLGKETNPEGAGMVHLENLTNIPFYALNNQPGSIFFTDSLVIDEGESGDEYCFIYIYGYALVEFPYLYITSGDGILSEASIRPLINVSKDYVVGGTTVSENDTLWENFVKYFKNTELLKTMIEPNDNSVDITSTSDSLKVVLSDGTNTFTTNFTYADGIVTYVPSSSDESAVADSIWVINCIYALSDLKGYNVEKVIDFLGQDKEFTLSKDGIEFENKDISLEDNSSFVDINFSTDVYTKFKLDIKNGLKTFSNYNADDGKDDNQTNQNNQNNKVDKNQNVTVNPQTGGVISFGIILLVSFVIAYYAYIKSIKCN